jgi:hypothetical protein
MTDHDGMEGGTVAHLLAGGEILRSQLARSTTWSPEKRLAAAVFTAALMHIRNHYGDPVHAETVREDLAWVASDDPTQPFGFVWLCEAFDLDPAWVRETVARWTRTERGARAAMFSLHRHAA